MPKPNYSFAKRQRELAKKQKQEAKRLKKAPADSQPSGEQDRETAANSSSTEGGQEQISSRE